MHLEHLHIRTPIPYARSLLLQEKALERNFVYKTRVLRSKGQTSQSLQTKLPQPSPTLLTFQTEPVYTVGRRHLKSNPLSQSQIDFLTTNVSSPKAEEPANSRQLATFYPAPRGGLLTYHAPGQLTAYLILNLRDHSITPRCFIRLLESAVIGTCAKHGVTNALTTEDPGVWIGEKSYETPKDLQDDEFTCANSTNLKATTRKICAIGVHVTRGITSHGIGLNVVDTAFPELHKLRSYTAALNNGESSQPAPGYLSWGFDRIVACGLEGKSVTWLTREGAPAGTAIETVADTLSEQVRKSIAQYGKIDIIGVKQIDEDDLLKDQKSSSEGEVI